MPEYPIGWMNRSEGDKETPSKLRWVQDVDGVEFQLYIPKWRIPDPWPARIWTIVMPRRDISDDSPNLAERQTQEDSSLRMEPIVATLINDEERTETIRYKPSGKSKAEIGEPYVPFSMTFGGAERLRIIVFWDLASRGQFAHLDLTHF